MSNALGQKKQEILYKVCVLGMSGVGKRVFFLYSDVLRTYGPADDDYPPKQFVVDGETCLVDLRHVIDEFEYSVLREQLIRGSDAFLIIYDVTARKSFAQVEKIWDIIQDVKRRDLEDRQNKTAFPRRPGENECTGVRDGKCRTAVVVGNKIDVVEGRVVSREEGNRLAEKLGTGFKEMSAKTGEGVNELMESLVRVVIREWEAEKREKREKQELEDKAIREKWESKAKNERRKLSWWRRLLR